MPTSSREPRWWRCRRPRSSTIGSTGSGPRRGGKVATAPRADCERSLARSKSFSKASKVRFVLPFSANGDSDWTFADASDFLKTNPYPGRPLAQTLDPSPRRRKRIDLLYPFRCLCGRSEAEEDDDDESGWGWGGEDEQETSRKGRRPEPFKWTEELMASFREALDPLIIMDYLIRNTCAFPPSPPREDELTPARK